MSGLCVLLVEGMGPTSSRRFDADLRACAGSVKLEVVTPGGVDAALARGRWDALVVTADAFAEVERAGLIERTRDQGITVLTGSPDALERSLRRLRRVLEARTEELRRARVELEAREEQLRHAQKMEVIGNFAGGIAHDFNNVVMSISGYGSMLLKEWPADHPGRGDIAEIMRSAQHAQALARQLLDFARKVVHAPKPARLADVILDVDQLLRRSAGPRITLDMRLQRDASAIRCDANQIQQVLLNLVLNARDAMPGGGDVRIEVDDVTLTDSMDAVDGTIEPGRWVRLTVIDRGVGMDAETRARALEPFYTTKASGQGTGLGLAIVHDILRRAGAQLRLTSEPGAGTTFDIFFRPIAPPGQSNGTSPRREREQHVAGL